MFEVSLKILLSITAGFFLALALYVSVRMFRRYTYQQDTLVMGCCALYKPYEFKNDDGLIQGFDIDLAQEIAKHLGKKLIIKDIGFDSLILSLQRNKIDMIISAMSITKQRLQHVDMIPYYDCEPIKELALLFWKKSPHDITEINELKSHFMNIGQKPVFAVQSGTLPENIANKLDWTSKRLFDSVDEMILDIQYNKSVAALVPPNVAQVYQKEHPGNFVSISLPMDKEDWTHGNGIAFNKENKEFKEKVRTIVDQLRDKGYIAYLQNKWLHKMQKKSTC